MGNVGKPRERKGVENYYFGGSGTEETLRANKRAWEFFALRPRVLAAPKTVNLGTVILARPVPSPIVVAPMAYLSLLEDDGELIMARRAAKSGFSFCLSMRSAVPLEKVATVFFANLAKQDSQCRPLLLFQLYLLRDRGISESLARRARAAGFDGLVVTVDTPYLGLRRRDRLNQFVVPEKFRTANITDELSLRSQTTSEDGTVSAFGVSFESNITSYAQDPTATWQDVANFRNEFPQWPIVLKGVSQVHDLSSSSEISDGVIISNHGGRQLDGSVSTAVVLMELGILDVAKSLTLMVDGGVDSGADVVRAQCLGADAVLIGRFFAKALFRSGEAGLKLAMMTIKEETWLAMNFLGAPNRESLDRSLIRFP